MHIRKCTCTLVVLLLSLCGCGKKEQKSSPLSNAPGNSAPNPFANPPRPPAPPANPSPSKEAQEAQEKAVNALKEQKVGIRPLYMGDSRWDVSFKDKDLTKEGTIKPEVLAHLKKLCVPTDVNFYNAPLREAGLAQLKEIPALRRLLISKNNTLTGAEFAKLAGCVRLRNIALYEVKITDAGLEGLNGLANLEEFEVDGADHLSAAGLAHLKRLPRLKKLTLQSFAKDSKLDDAALKEIGDIATLETLILGVEVPTSLSTRVKAFGDDGMAHLNKLKNLKELNLGCCERVTDAGLAKLKGLTNLESLNIGFTKISEDGLANLKDLTKLKELKLNGLKLTQKGMAHVGAFAKLESLDLRDCGEGVNDAAILRLKELKSLKNLMLYFTGVTEKGADELKKALPNLDIRLH